MSGKVTFVPLSYTGWGALDRLGEEVEKFGAKNILVVTDPFLVELGIAEKITAPLEREGRSLKVYTEIVPEPPLAIGERLAAFARQGNFDLVIGLGGGSALDLAKLAAVLAANEGEVADYLNLSGKRALQEKGLPKILIPTTSGTGSEVTNISVLSLESTKDVIAHDFLLADAAIVDPALTVTLPPNVTAATGVDALTHAVEAYISVNANAVTDGLALQAIKLIGRSIRTAVKDGEDRKARSDMSDGSFIAGLAFFNAGVAGVHALAYPLGGQFHLSHGESNAVLLPYVMDYIRPSCEERMGDIYEALGFDAVGLSAKEAAVRCVEELHQLVEDVDIKTSLQGFGIPASALDDLANAGAEQGRILARSPMPLVREDIYRIYESAYTGKSS